jgi:CO/xanthine dehydrogenase FAD-binding subunit
VPLPRPGLRTAFEKLRQRNAIDFPLLNVAVAAELTAAGATTAMTVVVSALGSRPRILTGLENVALGRPLDENTIDAVAQRAHAQCHPLTNLIVDPDWRRAMVPVYVRRALHGLRQAGRAA